MSYRVIIVDDEPLAREGLRDAVQRLAVPEIEVSAICENGVVALETIQHTAPEILLLDVAMPVVDGFALLEQLEPEAVPAVIFVTAYDQHAVRAFETEAVDYLVKPVTEARLRAALERAVRRITEARALARDLATPQESMTPRYMRQLVIPERGKSLVIPVEDIEWIEGDTYYVRVHSRERVRLLRDRLSRLETSLDPARFHRTHRSALVRLDLIRELRAETPYSFSALLATGARVPVSRERVKSLERALNRGSRIEGRGSSA